MGIHPVTVGVAVVIAAVLGWAGVRLGDAPLGGSGILLAWIVLYSARIAKQWQKSVILRLGRFHCLKGPGLFFVIPLVDTIPYWIDLRTVTTPFTAEETLTKDSRP